MECELAISTAKNQRSILGGNRKHARKARGPRYFGRPQAEEMVAESEISLSIPKLLARTGAAEFLEAPSPLPGNRATSESRPRGRLPAALSPQEFETMWVSKTVLRGIDVTGGGTLVAIILPLMALAMVDPELERGSGASFRLPRLSVTVVEEGLDQFRQRPEPAVQFLSPFRGCWHVDGWNAIFRKDFPSLSGEDYPSLHAVDVRLEDLSA